MISVHQCTFFFLANVKIVVDSVKILCYNGCKGEKHMTTMEERTKHCEKAVAALKANGFESFVVFGISQQINAYLPNGDVVTYMCRSEKILCHTKNEDGMVVMKWCGESGLGAFLRKLGIDYHEK